MFQPFARAATAVASVEISGFVEEIEGTASLIEAGLPISLGDPIVARLTVDESVALNGPGFLQSFSISVGSTVAIVGTGGFRAKLRGAR